MERLQNIHGQNYSGRLKLNEILKDLIEKKYFLLEKVLDFVNFFRTVHLFQSDLQRLLRRHIKYPHLKKKQKGVRMAYKLWCSFLFV